MRSALLRSLVLVSAAVVAGSCAADKASPVASTPVVQLTNLSLTPASLSGGQTGQADLEISRPAPAGGTTVSLTSSDAAAPVPPSVLLPEGATTWRFTVTTLRVTTEVSATITATVGSSSRTAVLQISPLPLPKVESLVFIPPIVEGGQTTTGTIRIDRLWPAATTVALSSDDSSLSVPASVQIPAGEATGTFTATTRQVTAQVVPRVTASSGGQSITVPVTVLARALPTIPNLFSYTSSTGDYIGQGRSATYTPSNATFLATAHCDGKQINIRVQIPRNDYWYIDMEAQQGGRLAAGAAFSNVPRYGFGGSGPSFSATGESRGCNQSYSSFQVIQAEFSSGVVSRFRATFEQHCENPNAPPLRGEISLNDVPMLAAEVRNNCR